MQTGSGSWLAQTSPPETDPHKLIRMSGVGTLARRRYRHRAFGRPAEHAATTVAQARPLPLHAGGDPLAIRNFRGTEPKHIAGAKSPLIVLREGMARCRKDRQRQDQACHCRIQVPWLEKIAAHLVSPDSCASCLLLPLAPEGKAVAAAESNHDTSRCAFNVGADHCTTILRAVASSTQQAGP